MPDLHDLLTREAEGLDVPAPPAGAVLHRAKGVRRRRRLVAGGAAVAAAAVVAGGVVAVGAMRGEQAVDPAVAAQQYADEGAFAVGRDVYIGQQHVEWDQEVKAIYYSSVGVVIRSGADPDTGTGPSRYAVVSPTGQIRPLGVSMADRIPGFEPDGRRFAYADNATATSLDVVVHDIPTDTEVARITLHGSFAWGGWEAPPVSIDGDHVYVHAGADGGWSDVDWRTGEVRQVPGTDKVYESANGFYATRTRDDEWTVHRWTDGSDVGTLPLKRGWYGFFSPDGRFLRTFPNEASPSQEPPGIVYDVETGATGEYPLGWNDDVETGWTPDGDMLIVEGDTVRVCGPVTGDCTQRTFDLGGGTVKVGGEPYES